MQDAAEAAALRLLGSRVEAQVAAARTAVPWLPPAPLPPGTSQYVDEVLACLRVGAGGGGGGDGAGGGASCWLW